MKLFIFLSTLEIAHIILLSQFCQTGIAWLKFFIGKD